MPFRQIKFTGAMKKAAQTAPCPNRVRAKSRRSMYSPHLGAKELARLAMREGGQDAHA